MKKSITLYMFPIVLLCLMIDLDMKYKNITSDLIGLNISELEKVIGIRYIDNLVAKGFIVYPWKVYKKGCGKGYSMTIYYNDDNIVTNVDNKVFYMCNDVVLLSKNKFINQGGVDYEFYIYPFFRFNINKV